MATEGDMTTEGKMTTEDEMAIIEAKIDTMTNEEKISIIEEKKATVHDIDKQMKWITMVQKHMSKEELNQYINNKVKNFFIKNKRPHVSIFPILSEKIKKKKKKSETESSKTKSSETESFI
tara:strand:+ start:3138 stop:3500 length:363 start_codon:yes stop_codon:yes gene_type:complete